MAAAGSCGVDCGRRPSTWRDMPVEGYITLGVVVACVVFVFVQLGPANILSSSTPAGGDMGAHVWGPAYLRDNLLPQGRLTGWTPDWYAGFPAYQFYMVLPSLLIALLSYVLPYGVAFKLVAISGLVSLPISAWAFGRLTRLPFPIPPLLAVAANDVPVRSIVLDPRRQHRVDACGRVRVLDVAQPRAAVPGCRRPRSRERQAPRLGRGSACAHRAVPPHPAVLRACRHARVVPAVHGMAESPGRRRWRHWRARRARERAADDD